MTEDVCFLDFETSSRTDLKHRGLGRYLADPSTRALCLGYRLPGAKVTELWTAGESLSWALISYLKAGKPFAAHNAPFDFWVWNRILRRDYPDAPLLDKTQVRCTAARARYNGLPDSLDKACHALHLPIQKDAEGKALMLELAKNPDWTPESHPELFARLFKYVITDVDAMRGLWYATQPLPAREQAFFELDMEINNRGFGVDVEGAEAMEELRALAEAQLDYQITLLTQGGVMAVTEVAKIKEYAQKFGEDLDDAGKETLVKLLEREALPAELKDVLRLRLDASRTPKKAAAILRAHVDGRMQHGTVYHGALSGRSTARGAGGAQMLNVARPRPGRKAKDCEEYLDAIKRRDTAFLSKPEVGPILAALADAQRPLFCATRPGHVLIGADLSGIEARMAPWCANDEEKLAAFDNGIDSYKLSAMAIYEGVMYDEVTGDQRQVGKVADLSLGFGGAVGALKKLGPNYGLHLDDDFAEMVVRRWRAGRPAFETWWATLEYSVLIALDQPGKEVVIPIGRDYSQQARFVRDEHALRMVLPSGRAISYHNARLQLDPGASAPIAVYDKPEGYVERLDRKILANNMTQGLARDIFWEMLLDVSRAEDIVHHVYDEIILEVPVERAELRLEQLLERMRTTSPWAPGLPLNAAGYIAPRWRKD